MGFNLVSLIPGVGPVLSFFQSIGGFIAKHWKAVAVVLMIATIGYQNFSAHRFLFVETIPSLETRLTAAQNQNKLLVKDLKLAANTNAKLTAIINNDNLTIQQWINVSSGLKKQTKALAKSLKHMSDINSQQAKTILNEKTPTTCKASIALLRNEIGKISW